MGTRTQGHRRSAAKRGERTRLRPVHVGCSGWNYTSWREVIYERGLASSHWLERYAELFETVEVNATFYRLTTPRAAARWLEQTPAEFVFAVKASRYLTHIRRLREVTDGIARYYAAIQPLVRSGRLGAVLWQLPGDFRRDDERLQALLRELPAGRHAFEFRHPSWFAEPVYALLREHGASLVLGDHPQRDFQTDEATADWHYVRLHHGRSGRRGNYSPAELDAWAKRLHRWRAQRELFVYFNNDWEGFAPRNARLLRRRLRELAHEGEQ
jgi:uncharacterized protein YecE (DUF72 family)